MTTYLIFLRMKYLAGVLALRCVFDFLLLYGIDSAQAHQIYGELMFALEHHNTRMRLAAVQGFTKLCYVRGLDDEGITLCLMSALFHSSTENDTEYVFILSAHVSAYFLVQIAANAGWIFSTICGSMHWSLLNLLLKV